MRRAKNKWILLWGHAPAAQREACRQSNHCNLRASVCTHLLNALGGQKPGGCADVFLLVRVSASSCPSLMQAIEPVRCRGPLPTICLVLVGRGLFLFKQGSNQTLAGQSCSNTPCSALGIWQTYTCICACACVCAC